ncbi:peptidoglycan bridge formation glycyltransferase FemA/FemB family protein [Candidatus Saccharibacteria bacterium]|nr:peptidoglycan bridge formation glycyltransferase FemA/FemB family protein [Candidatus Saccharibacteria bacterium]
MNFVELTDEEFRKFEHKQSCGNFFQSAERAELRRKMGWNVFLLGVKDEKKVLAGCLLMERGKEALVQLGPILDYSDTKLVKFWIKSVVEFAKTHGFISLEVFPPALLSIRDYKGEVLKSLDGAKLEMIFADAGFTYLGRTVELENKANRWMAIKNLGGFKNMDEVRASYKKNVRNKLRKISPELEVYELTDKSEIPMLAEAVDQSNHKNGVVSRYLSYYEWLWDAWGDNTRFIVARRKEDKAVVAGRILIYHPNEVVSFISGTTQRFKKLNGMTYLQDWLLEDCLERGVKRANFYGIDGDFSENNKLLEFKAGFGVDIEEYVGGFRLILQPGKYRLNNAKKAGMNALRSVRNFVRDNAKKIAKRRTKVVRKVETSK